MKTASISRELARFVHDLSLASLPGEVVERAKNLILDGLATAIAGRSLGFFRIGLELIKDNKGKVTVLGNKMKVPVVDAAFINSVLLTSIGQSDEMGRGHPGDVVLPATIAAAEEEDRSGAEVITALVAGYDIFGRIWLGGTSIIPRFRATPVIGPIAAAAAAGKLLGLSEDQLTNALGLAANFSSGFLEGYESGTMETRFHNPIASRSGATAAILARAGATAAETTLEGKTGFYQAFAGTNEGLDIVTADLGRRFMIMEALYKPFPCCGSLQNTTDLSLRLVKQHNIKTGDIEKLTVVLPHDVYSYPGINYTGPMSTTVKAKMSGRFCTAASFSGKPVNSFAFFNDNYGDPEVAELAKKVELAGEKARDGSRMTKIEVTVKGGRQYSIEGNGKDVLVPTTDRIKMKFEGLAAGLLGKERAAKVIDIVLNLEKADNIRLLTRELE